MPHARIIKVDERFELLSRSVRTEIHMTGDKKTSNRWRDEHESLPLQICSKSEDRTIGGPTDGKMACAKELWQRVHVEFMADLPRLNSTLVSKRSSLPRTEFSPDDLHRRFAT
jgi:hypothetical protein